MSQAKLGDLVAAEMGRTKPYSQGAVTLWFNDGVRDVDVIWALARACGVHFLWLATGEGPMRASAGAAEEEIAMNPRPKLTATEAIQELRAGGDPATPRKGTRRRKAE